MTSGYVPLYALSRHRSRRVRVRDVGSVVVPPLLWQHPDMRAALEARDLGRLLRLVTKYAGATQGELANALGRTQPEVSRYMRGNRRAVSLEVWEAVADGLGMPDMARCALGLAPATVGESSTTTDSALVYWPRDWSGRRRGSLILGIDR